MTECGLSERAMEWLADIEPKRKSAALLVCEKRRKLCVSRPIATATTGGGDCCIVDVKDALVEREIARLALLEVLDGCDEIHYNEHSIIATRWISADVSYQTVADTALWRVMSESLVRRGDPDFVQVADPSCLRVYANTMFPRLLYAGHACKFTRPTRLVIGGTQPALKFVFEWIKLFPKCKHIEITCAISDPYTLGVITPALSIMSSALQCFEHVTINMSSQAGLSVRVKLLKALTQSCQNLHLSPETGMEFAENLQAHMADTISIWQKLHFGTDTIFDTKTLPTPASKYTHSACGRPEALAIESKKRVICTGVPPLPTLSIIMGTNRFCKCESPTCQCGEPLSESATGRVAITKPSASYFQDTSVVPLMALKPDLRLTAIDSDANYQLFCKAVSSGLLTDYLCQGNDLLATLRQFKGRLKSVSMHGVWLSAASLLAIGACLGPDTRLLLGACAVTRQNADCIATVLRHWPGRYLPICPTVQTPPSLATVWRYCEQLVDAASSNSQWLHPSPCIVQATGAVRLPLQDELCTRRHRKTNQ